MTITSSSPKQASKKASQKVSMTLRVPSDLKEWAEDFATRSHLTVSDVFILSLRQTKTSGKIEITPIPPLIIEDIEDTPITPEKLAYYQGLCREHDELERQGKVQYRTWEELKTRHLQEI